MSNPPEPEKHAQAQDDLALLALGEAVSPEIVFHVAGCAECQQELAAYRHVVDLAAVDERVLGPDESPPPGVWDRIATSVGAPAPAPPAPVVPLAARRRRPRVRLVAAALVLAAAAGAAGWAVGHETGGGTAAQTARAALRAQPGTAENVHGTAVVHASADGYRLEVDTRGLPARTGYYEVWLYDPSINTMVAVGTLGTGGRGTFTVPAGIDLAAFHVVDVSAQSYDGNAAHQRSVLRGPLSR